MTSGKDNLSKYKIIALDTNIFIYHFSENSQLSKLAEEVFTALVEDKLKAVTSSLTLAELLSFKTTDIDIKELTESFMTTPNLTVLPFNNELAYEAARIRRTYGFKLPDSIHLATAKKGSADAFITADLKLNSFPELPVIN